MNLNKFLLIVWLPVLLLGCQDEKKIFTSVNAAHSGIDFENVIEETPEKNVMVYEYYYNGGGVAAADFNNDGLCDLYFTGNNVPNKLYLNKGSLAFEDVTTAAGVAGRNAWKTGVTVADVNSDGWLDIYVSYSGPVRKEDLYDELYINSGSHGGDVPTFKESAKVYGLDSPLTFTTQATFFDMDNDGDLDMFQSNHGHRYFSPFFNTRKVRQKRHPQFGNRLYRNDGKKFVEISEAAGIHGGGLNFGLSACAADINNDGWMDLYVTNDFEEQDYLYINNHNQTFREVNNQATGHTSKFSMGSDVADFNNDLLPDVLVVDMLPETLERQKLLKGADEYDRYTLMVDSGFHHQNMRNTLQLNRGNAKDGTPRFSEIGVLAGVHNTDWSWSALMADLDNDGYKDIFITNGFLRDFTNLDFLKYTYQDASDMAKMKNTIVPVYEMIKKMPSTTLSNFVFSNNKDFTFSNKTKAWGLDVPMMSFGAVYVDLDNDGDLELVTNNTNEKATLWENHTNEMLTHYYVKVKLKGKGKNTFAIGAKVYVESGDVKQMQELVPSRGFQSSMDYVLNFGLGTHAKTVRVKVVWPDGNISSEEADVNSILIFDQQTSAVPQTQPINESEIKTFTEFTAASGLQYRHAENKFIDFKSELLLPAQLSHNGPCLAKGDVNGDGYEDFFIGGAAGEAGSLFEQTPKQIFVERNTGIFEIDKQCEDTGAILFDADGDGDLDLYVVSGGHEFQLGAPQLLDRFYSNDGKGNFKRLMNAIPKEFSNGSCVRAADYDRDGDPDLFVGGKSEPGKFPMASPGGILRNDSDHKSNTIKFVLATNEVNQTLRSPGMVTDALWADVNNDQWPDLIIVGEWMAVKIFINNKGKLELLQSNVLENNTGLWSKIIGDDFDKDGDIDFIVANVGENLQWKPAEAQPMTLYASDFDNNGKLDPVICTRINGLDYPVASRDELLEQMPSLKKKFVFYKDYAKADITKIFTHEQLANAKKLTVQTFQSWYLENKGKDGFAFRPLPKSAQFSKINGLIVDDFDRDGNKDVLVAGNYFPYRVQYGKSDASIGLLLKGDGKGNFIPIDHSASGFFADGDVRDMVMLQSPTGNLVVVGKNNDHLQVIKVNQPENLKSKK